MVRLVGREVRCGSPSRWEWDGCAGKTWVYTANQYSAILRATYLPGPRSSFTAGRIGQPLESYLPSE